MNISDKLNNLIQYALADGVLTEKEKSVLLKNAIEEGNDADEFEMYLSALLFEKQQALKREALAEMPPPPVVDKATSNKEGDIKKCPSCGASVKSFTSKCGECGHEFRGLNSENSITKLFDLLIECDNLKDEYNNNDKSTGISKLFGLGIFHSSMNRFQHQERILSRKLQIINTFPIPNSKESILEFLTTAAPLSKKVGSIWTETPATKIQNTLADVWLKKCEQVITKARFLLKDDKKTLEEIEYYAKQLKIK
jgi:hypothetical protein